MAFTKITRVTKQCTLSSTWQDIDLSSNIPSTATGVMLQIECQSGSRTVGIRKNGSTDNRTALSSGAHVRAWSIVGVDASEIFEGYIQDISVDFFLIGYCTTGFTSNTNATDISQTNINTYEDVVLPSGALAGVIEVVTTDFQSYALRENGTSSDIYRNAARHNWAFVPTDASQIIETKISTTNVDYFLTGYFSSGGGSTPTPKVLALLGVG